MVTRKIPKHYEQKIDNFTANYLDQSEGLDDLGKERKLEDLKRSERIRQGGATGYDLEVGSEEERIQKEIAKEAIDRTQTRKNTKLESAVASIQSIPDDLTFGLASSVIREGLDFLYKQADVYLNDEKFLTEEEWKNHPDRLPGQEYNPYLTNSQISRTRDRAEARQDYDQIYENVSWFNPIWWGSKAVGLYGGGKVAGSIIKGGAKLAGTAEKYIAPKLDQLLTKVAAEMPNVAAPNTLNEAAAFIVAEGMINSGLSTTSLSSLKRQLTEEGKDVSDLHYLNSSAMYVDWLLPIAFRGIPAGYSKYQSLKNDLISNNMIKASEKMGNNDIKSIDDVSIKDSEIIAKRGLLMEAKALSDENNVLPNYTQKTSYEINTAEGITRLPAIINVKGIDGNIKQHGVEYRVTEADSLYKTNISKNIEKNPISQKYLSEIESTRRNKISLEDNTEKLTADYEKQLLEQKRSLEFIKDKDIVERDRQKLKLQEIEDKYRQDINENNKNLKEIDSKLSYLENIYNKHYRSGDFNELNINPLDRNNGNFPFINKAGKLVSGENLINKINGEANFKDYYRKSLVDMGYNIDNFENPILVRRESEEVLNKVKFLSDHLENEQANFEKNTGINPKEEINIITDDIINSKEISQSDIDIIEKHFPEQGKTILEKKEKYKGIFKKAQEFVNCIIS